jgi:hypothetical protein
MIVRFANALLIIGYLAAVSFGVIQFSIWGQIEDLLGTELTLDFLFGTAHGLRYALVLPVFVVSDWLSQDESLIFSSVVATLVVAIGLWIGQAIRAISRTDSQLAFTFGLIGSMGIALFMHGRIAYAFAGFALLLAGLLKPRATLADGIGLFLRFLLAIFLSSVSSGTIMVTALTGFLFTVMAAAGVNGLKTTGRAAHISLLLHLALLPAGVFYLFLLVEKNLSFYGEGIDAFVNILGHGVGVVFLNAETLVVVFSAIIVVLIVGMFLIWTIQSMMVKPIIIGMGCAAAGGLFGFSTMAMGLIPLTILLGVWLLGVLKHVSSLAGHGRREFAEQ